MIEIHERQKFTTLKTPARIEGQAPFMKDTSVIMTIHPHTKSGFIFRYKDVEIPVIYRNLAENGKGSHTTSISSNNTTISFIEHILSALTGIGIEGAIIQLDGAPQVPALDGCASQFYKILKKAGKKIVHSQNLEIRISKIMYFHDGSGSSAILRPSSEKKYSALIQFPEPIGEQYFTATINNYRKEIGWARTFIRSSYTEDMWADVCSLLPTLPSDVTQSPVLVFKGKRWLVTPDKPDEPVRHKLLDAIGDLSTLGYPLTADISLVRPGHEFNRKLVTHIGTLIEKTFPDRIP